MKKKIGPAGGAIGLFNQQQSGSSQPHYNSKNNRGYEGENATGINFYGGNTHLMPPNFPYSHNNGP